MASNKAQKKKIVFVLPALTAGGAERVLITLMNNLDRALYDPAFVTVNDTGPLREIIDPEIPFHSLHGRRVSLSIPKLYLKLKALKPDIVISTMAHMNLSLLLLKPLLPKTRFIVREAITPSFLLDEHPRLAFALRAAYRMFYPMASQVISPAQTIIDEFNDVLGMSCKNHSLLYNPVDLNRIRAEDDQTFTLAPDRGDTVHFIAAGRLHHQKGFDRLIEALPELGDAYNWKLTILGEGPERASLETLITEKGLEDKVYLPGLSSAPWPEFAAVDCFVMPSRWEGLPNVVLESLACGVPVIATKESGGIDEISKLAPNGSVTVVDDMQEFLNAMRSVKPNPTDSFRKSLLPQEFQIETVLAQFSKILEAV